MLLKDLGRIPEDKTFTRRLACWQKHPGLCFERDAAIYDDSLGLARNFERFFIDPVLHKYVKLVTDRFDILVVYFCFQRARRPHAQVTHAFIECEEVIAGDRSMITTTSKPAGLYRTYKFAAVWHVAAQLLRAGAAGVHAYVGDHVWAIPKESAEALVEWADVGVCLWPGVYRMPRAPKPPMHPALAALLRMDREPDKPKKKNSGGIRILVGTKRNKQVAVETSSSELETDETEVEEEPPPPKTIHKKHVPPKKPEDGESSEVESPPPKKLHKKHVPPKKPEDGESSEVEPPPPKKPKPDGPPPVPIIRIELPDGWGTIVVDVGRGHLNAECGNADHGNKCHCDRQNFYQGPKLGRPMGLLLAWLRRQRGISRERHQTLKKEIDVEGRRDGRRWGEGFGDLLTPAWDAEELGRIPREDERWEHA